MNDGGWNMDDAQSSYEQFCLSHGKTPGSAGSGGGSGGYTAGRIARQMFFLVLVCSLLAFMPSGVPLLVALGAPLVLSAAFALATYGILWLIAKAVQKRAAERAIVHE
ncbi:MAG: hypothetical protein ACOX8N_08595 [Christensenellales bacterium]|jgi:hypothetical protein